MSCLHEIFEAQADRRPSDLALVHQNGSLTYQELEHRANRLARYLRSLGAAPGELVGIYLERSEEAIVAILAVLKAGAAYVPIDPAYPGERILHIVTEAGVGILIADSHVAERVEHGLVSTLLVIDAEKHRTAIGIQEARRLSREENGVSPDDLCYVIYTSGTTGRPKGIMTEHRNVVDFTASFKDVCGLDTSDRIYQGFSLGFDGSVEEIWMAFSAGATLVLGPPELSRLGDETGRYMADKGVTYFSTVPTFLSMIKEDVSSLRLIVVSGEPCPAGLVSSWVRPGRRMLNVYGPTETTVNATAWDCVPGKPVTIGRPLRGYDLHILDDRLQPVPRGEAGHLHIGGVGVSRGYLGQPELTQECFIEKPQWMDGNGARLYRTGDLVRESVNGDLVFLGRIDGQVKVRGYRIELAEIESVLRDHPGIEAAAVTVVEQGGLRELAAHVVPARRARQARETGSELDRDQVLDLLRSRLPLYMVPTYLDTLDELPTLASGKVDRKRLPKPRTPLVRGKREFVAPRNDIERRIAGVWESIFETGPVSIDADFFLDLGGYSLMVALLVALLESEEDIAVSLRDVYENPTVAALARLVSDRATAGQEDERARAKTRTTSAQAFSMVRPARRYVCILLQALSAICLYGLAFMPVLAATLVFRSILGGHMREPSGIGILIALSLLFYPVWVGLTIGLKWLVIGRYRAGSFPVWSLRYFRFWLGARIQAMSGIGLVSGTPLMSLYYRLMGARVGRNCIIDTPLCVTHDLVTIGDDTSIGSETQLLGYRVEDGFVHVGRVDIGSRCFIGIHSCLGLDTRMGDDARLGDLSLLPDREEVAEGESRQGSPARSADVEVPVVQAEEAGAPDAGTGRRRPILYGLLHALLIGFLEIVLVVALVPPLAIVVPAFMRGGLSWGVVSVFLAVPVGVVAFCLIMAGFKALILRRVEPGTYSIESSLFLRKWLVDALVAVSRTYMHALYTTIYLPPWLRMLGARIGSRAEISTVSQVTPDLIDIEDESFFADGSIIGGRRFFRGSVQFGRNRIGRRSFVGNNSILPIGINLGDNCLLGVLSKSPDGRETTPDGTEWLGSPSFRLPYRKKVEGFDESVTYAPTRALYIKRFAIDAVRILIPGIILALGAFAFFSATMESLSRFPLWAVFLLAPLLALSVAIGSALCVVVVKLAAMGRFTPVIKPLWSTYVWWNEVVNGAYESVAAPALAPLLGTPFFNGYLKLLGCKIGSHAYIGTTLFSEFDLVEIGDHAALNTGVVVQNHLFEDRIMKSSYVRIGNECSIGNMAVVLYDTEMGTGSSLGPLTLLMKGEVVPDLGRRLGIPAGPVE